MAVARNMKKCCFPEFLLWIAFPGSAGTVEDRSYEIFTRSFSDLSIPKSLS